MKQNSSHIIHCRPWKFKGQISFPNRGVRTRVMRPQTWRVPIAGCSLLRLGTNARTKYLLKFRTSVISCFFPQWGPFPANHCCISYTWWKLACKTHRMGWKVTLQPSAGILLELPEDSGSVTTPVTCCHPENTLLTGFFHVTVYSWPVLFLAFLLKGHLPKWSRQAYEEPSPRPRGRHCTGSELTGSEVRDAR